MYNVKILPNAEKDITDIYTYLKYRLHVPELAENFRKEVISTVLHAERKPAPWQ